MGDVVQLGYRPEHFGAFRGKPEIPLHRVKAGDGYFDLELGEEMRYWSEEWVSVSTMVLTCGRNGTTPPGTFFRGANGLYMGPDSGFIVPTGTLVRIGVVRKEGGSLAIEVLTNGESFVRVEVPGPFVSESLSEEFPEGVLSVKLAADSATARDTQITLYFKQRA